jgi:hypothetical protein
MVQAFLEWNSSPLHFHQTLTYVTGRTKQCIRSRMIKFLRMSIGPLIASPAKVPSKQRVGSSSLPGRAIFPSKTALSSLWKRATY